MGLHFTGDLEVANFLLGTLSCSGNENNLFYLINIFHKNKFKKTFDGKTRTNSNAYYRTDNSMSVASVYQ